MFKAITTGLSVLFLLANVSTASAESRDATWQLCSIVDEGNEIDMTEFDTTLSIGEKEFEGNSACNRYGGEYVNKPGQPFANIWATEMACEDDDRMYAEDLYFRHLNEAESLEEETESLIITTKAGDRLFYSRAGDCGAE